MEVASDQAIFQKNQSNNSKCHSEFRKCQKMTFFDILDKCQMTKMAQSIAIWVSNEPIWSDELISELKNPFWCIKLNKKFENTMNVIFPMYFGEKRGVPAPGLPHHRGS